MYGVLEWKSRLDFEKTDISRLFFYGAGVHWSVMMLFTVATFLKARTFVTYIAVYLQVEYRFLQLIPF